METVPGGPGSRSWRLALGRRPWQTAAGVALLLGLLAGFIYLLPDGVDWHSAFRPAALALLAGHSPYSIPGYFNAPWTLIPLLPFAVMPEQVGRGALALAGFLCFAYAAVRLGAKPVTLALFLFSPPVLHSTLNGNLDWLALLGAVLPHNIGLLLLATKPQIGAAVIVLWLFEAWHQGGARRVVHDFWPLAALTGLSLAVFGLWPLRFGREVDLWWNASLWPASIPFGLAFLAIALTRRRIRPALVASPLLSPYVLLHSWVGALAAVLDSLPVAAASILGVWILVALHVFGG